MDQKKLALGALIILAILFLFQRKNGKDAPPAPQPPEGAVQKINPVQGGMPKTPAVSVDDLRAAYVQRLKAGITMAAMPVSKDGIQLTLKLTPHLLWCRGGEVDTMERMVTNWKNPEFLMTVESIDKSAQPLWRQTLAALELRQEKVFHFTLPVAEKTKAFLGIYLCQDLDRKGRCQGKPAVDYVVQSHNINGSMGQRDYVYAFHQVLADKDGKLEFFSAYGNKEQTEAGKAYLAANSDIGRQNIAQAAGLATALRSVPIQFVNNQVELHLTASNPACTR